MVDPITIGAGWGLSAAGWLISPIISRLLNKAFDHLDFNATEKLKILDVQVLQLQRALEVADESTYRVRLEPLLEMLKSALYEAEDILDRVQYKSIKKQIQDAKSDGKTMDWLKKNLRSPLIDKATGMRKDKLEESLKKIESAISDACEVMKQLTLPGVSMDNGKSDAATNSRSESISSLLRVIGRDEDRDKIIAMLDEQVDQCQANKISGTCHSVIGIHGFTGSGKSTLARCVYDHEIKKKQDKAKGHFEIVIWVHVSQKFELDSIFRDMFEGVTGKLCPKFSGLHNLKENLENKLRKKRILLVLDDVWYNNRNLGDHEKLQKLISPLNVGKAGSKILVTSRREDALLAVGAVKERCIPISDLDEKVFLKMFMYYALPDATVGDQERKKLETVGEDIAKKLKRSPLAARTVGARLRLNPKFEFWMREKDRDFMKETMGALWWSYKYLDEQVRRCFAYCSIFPRRHRLNRDELVKLWVAEGFIKTSNAEEEMEDVAKEYFDELISASFLQLGGKEYVDGREVEYFTIHDLLCDLAEVVAGRDWFRIEKGCEKKIPQDVRYLFVGTYNEEMFAKNKDQLKNVRTLIIDGNIRIQSTHEREAFVSMFTMFTELTKLRVLKLSAGGFGLGRFSLPNSIVKWKYLRYFALVVGAMTKLTLPSTFTKLYHMQVVDFGFSHVLEFSSGEDMMNLVNLRRIISNADLKFPNIGRLTWLQMLPYFTIRKKHGYESHQLKHLNNLQGKLQVHGLENVESKEQAVEVNLAGKEKLTELILVWDNKSCTPEVQAEVLEGLCPSKYLERLVIGNYKGKRIPSWLMGTHNGSPKNLQELEFDGCSWDALPGNMEHLTLLKNAIMRNDRGY